MNRDEGAYYFYSKKMKACKITGKVTSGTGKGAYYVNKYKKLFHKELGFLPYEGTLNLEVDETELKKFLKNIKKITIEEFSDKEGTFGAVHCYPAKIENLEKIKCAIVIPEKTKHKRSTIEVICEKHLREALNIKDDSRINISNQ
ncbi:MAG: DUF120 domain-containing protein [Nanoarchaeota archaeon]|nr:DUF120 domain-containing protein [Nanoarchaeota archaeon]